MMKANRAIRSAQLGLLLFLGMLSFISIGCPTAIEPGIEPPTPVMVDISRPPAPEETGVFADLGGSPLAIIIQWHPDSVLGRTTGYRVYRSLDSSTNGAGQLLNSILLASFESSFPYPVDTFYRDTASLAIGPTFYYQVQAFNRSATNRVTYSQATRAGHAASYRLLSVPLVSDPRGETTIPVEGLPFQFTDTDQITPGGTFQIIVRDLSGGFVWASAGFSAFSAQNQELYPTDPSQAAPLIPGHTYDWRVRKLGDNAGSSSLRQIFTIQ